MKNPPVRTRETTIDRVENAGSPPFGQSMRAARIDRTVMKYIVPSHSVDAAYPFRWTGDYRLGPTSVGPGRSSGSTAHEGAPHQKIQRNRAPWPKRSRTRR
jgi:hypothetical protein